MAVDHGRWVAVCTREKLDAQRMVCGTVAGVGLLIILDGDEVVACERACPHEQADLSLGRVDKGRLHCPHHRMSFCLKTGVVSPGWPSQPLRCYPTRYDDSRVWVDAEAIDRSKRRARIAD